MHYSVIRAKEIEALIDLVNDALRNGYEPVGGIEIVNITQAMPQLAFAFMQAVVKKS